MGQAPMRLEFWQYVVILIISGMVMGILLGLVPLFIGRKRNNRKLGKLGFISCVLAGIIGPWLSLIVAIVFTILILRSKPKTLAEESATPPEQEII